MTNPKSRLINHEGLFIIRYLLKWFLLAIPLALLVGSLVALFLYLLEIATQAHWQHPWLLYFLPLAGLIIVALYQFKGKNAEAGNNLLIDEIHKPGGGIPRRMAPFILITTIVTHLFGGSAGREGTAVQIGGSMASFLAKALRLSAHDRRILLIMGIAAGFGAVFGTPLAGTIFALEVLIIGRIRYDALLPAFVAAILADGVCMAWGAHHTHYEIQLLQSSGAMSFAGLDPVLLIKILIGAIAFGLAAQLFAAISHTIKTLAHKYIPHKLLIPLLGGSLIIGLSFLLGTTDYLGLGVETASGRGNSIVNAFSEGNIDSMAWFWKILFTAITLSMGFKGGEVTPLFFIGATLGSTLAVFLGVPIDLMAGLGFIAVFAGATNTPLACTIMGAELFGGHLILYYAIACFTAFYFSGKTGIYTAQLSEMDKSGMIKTFR